MSSIKLMSHPDNDLAYVSSFGDDKWIEGIQSIEFETAPNNKYYPISFAKIEIVGLDVDLIADALVIKRDINGNLLEEENCEIHIIAHKYGDCVITKNNEKMSGISKLKIVANVNDNFHKWKAYITQIIGE